MKQTATVNQYYYRDLNTGAHTVELELINHDTGAVQWKLYRADSKQKVLAIAKRQTTKYLKSAHSAGRGS